MSLAQDASAEVGRTAPVTELVLPVRRVTQAPSLTDGFVRTVSARIGGPLGRHAAVGLHWWTPQRVVLLTATVCYLIGVFWRLPCRITAPGQNPDAFKLMCYSDIGLLYSGRGLMQGNTPYLDTGNYDVLEYPALTGWFLELERRLTALLGGVQGAELTAEQQVHSTLVFVDVNTVLLGLCFLVAVWAMLRTVPDRPWDVMMLAASPCVAAAALINWDLLAVALTALALMFWSRRRPGLAGLLLGLAAAAKLYPLFLLGPLLLLCLRSNRLQAFAQLIGATVISWSVVNLPVMLLAPAAWLHFWQFNADRGPDLGSIWYVLTLAGYQIGHVNLLSNGFFLLGCLGIAALILLAPRRPRLGQVAFLVVLAFVMSGKVYSPQYVLWLVPLLVLARPRWRDWWVFTAGELLYFGAIWWYLGGELAPGGGDQARLYWLAVIVRICTQAYVGVLVVRDILRPGYDPVRRAGADDPAGGCWIGLATHPGCGRLLRSPRQLARRCHPERPSMATEATRPLERVAPADGGRGLLGTLWSGRVVVQAWLLSRGLIALVALLLAVVKGYDLVDEVSNWDVQHFERLAAGGYLAEPNHQLMAFFPGLSVILGAFAWVGVPMWLTGVVLAGVGSALAAAALVRLGGPWAAIAWLFAPTAVFTTVPYTESLFCAAAFWAWERARADRWGAAAALAAVACTVRVSGLFLVGALFVMVLTTRNISWATRARRAAWLLIPTAVLGAFATYLWTLTGSWLAWYQAQSTGWVRQFTWPWQSFLNTIPAILPGAYADHPWWAAVFRAEMASMALGLIVTVYCLIRRRWAEASWVGVQVLAFSLSYWFFSVNRAILLWFPLWIMLAEWGTWQPRGRIPRVAHRMLVLLVAGCMVFSMIFWSWLFFTGHWAS